MKNWFTKIGGLFFFLCLFQVQVNAQRFVKPAPDYSRDTLSQGKGLYFKTGVASFYHRNFQGKRTASGERYSRKKLTAAHRFLPLHTKVKVTSLKTGKWVIVRINDRGPYNRKRILDLSERAAKHLGLKRAHGLIRVSVEELPDSSSIWIHHPPNKINEKEVY